MSNAQTLADLAAPQTDGPPRDRWGRYVIDHEPFAGKSLQRVTTFIGMLKDSYALAQWQMRNVAKGVAASPDLAELVTATDDKDTLAQLCELALSKAGANEGRDIGTAIHAATEAADRNGGDYDGPYAAEVAAWRTALDEHGLVIHTDLIEVSVAHERYRVCGTADRIVETPEHGLVVLDIKTGNVERSAGVNVMQGHCYASASHVWDWPNDRLAAMPEVNQSIGIVAHLQPGGPCTLHWMDLAAGADGVALCLAIRDDWRPRKGLLVPMADGAPTFGKPKRKARKAAAPKAPKALTVDRAVELVPELDALRSYDAAAFGMVVDTLADAADKACRWSIEANVVKLTALYALAKHVQDVDLARAVVADVLVAQEGDDRVAVPLQFGDTNGTLAELLEAVTDADATHITGVANVAEMAFAPDGVPYVKSYSYGNPLRREHVLTHLAPLLDGDKRAVAERWPAMVPPPKRSDEWTEIHMETIERQFGLAFWPVNPDERQRT